MGIEHLAVGFHEASLHSAAPCPGLRDAVHGLATGCPFQWVHTYLLLSSVCMLYVCTYICMYVCMYVCTYNKPCAYVPIRYLPTYLPSLYVMYIQ